MEKWQKRRKNNGPLKYSTEALEVSIWKKNPLIEYRKTFLEKMIFEVVKVGYDIVRAILLHFWTMCTINKVFFFWYSYIQSRVFCDMDISCHFHIAMPVPEG